jgi:hypothetical protein
VAAKPIRRNIGTATGSKNLNQYENNIFYLHSELFIAHLCTKSIRAYCGSLWPCVDTWDEGQEPRQNQLE